MARKMATIQRIEVILPIPKADRIELVQIKGWQVVVGKGLYKVGDYCVYHEIDSLCPEVEPYKSDLEPRGTKLSQLEDGTIVRGYRIKTIELRKTLSQGYCVPLTAYNDEQFAYFNNKLRNDYDLTEYLGITVYEKPETAGEREEAAREVVPKSGYKKYKWLFRKFLEAKFPFWFKKKRIKGGYPSFLPKTECIRVQNHSHQMYAHYLNDTRFQVSVKLDGSSIGVFKNVKDIGVCSRNLRKNVKSIHDKFIVNAQPFFRRFEANKKFPNYAFQGELISPSIQENFENVSHDSVNIYSIYDIDNQQYINPERAKEIVKELSLTYVPVLEESITLRELFPSIVDEVDLVKQILKYADGPSSMNGKYREGVVFKELTDGYKSIKAISNSYLLKQAD